MVKLRGPLASNQASGLLSGGLVFRSTPNGPVLCSHSPRRKPTHLIARQNQTLIAALTSTWHEVSQALRDNWIPLARKWAIPPYTAYIKQNLLWWRDWEGLSLDPEHGSTLNPGSAGAPYAKLWGDNVALWCTKTTSPYAFIITWHRNPTSPFTCTFYNMVAAANWKAGHKHEVCDFHPPSGTWKYRILKHSIDGYRLQGSAYATVTVP